MSGFTFGDIIAISATLTSVTYQSIGNGLGTLTLMDGTHLVGTMTLAGNYAADAFQVAPDIQGVGAVSYSSGTQITLITGTPGGAITPNPGTVAADHYTWIAAKGGNWGAAVNWTDTSTGASPATVAPGSNDVVSITAGAAGIETGVVINGPGHAAGLALGGQLTLNGTYVLGTLGLGASTSAYVDLAPGTVVNAGTATIMNGSLSVSDTGSGVTISGALTLGGGSFSYANVNAFNGGAIQIGSLALTSSYNALNTSGGGTIEIGSTGGSAAGKLTVDAGQVVSGVATFTTDAGLVNNGVIRALGGTLRLNGDVSGSGTLQIGAGGNLVLVGSNTEAVAFTGAGGTLTVSVGGYGPIVPVNETGIISGFAAGDTIQAGQILTAVNYRSTGTNIGTLTLMYGTSVIATLTLAGAYTTGGFKMTLAQAPLGAVTNITLGAGLATPGSTPSAGTTAPNAYSLNSSGVLNWGDAANWSDTTTGATPAAVAPGSTDTVQVTGPSYSPTGLAALVLDGPGNAAGLSLTGTTVLSGAYTVGALALGLGGTALTLAPGTVVNAASASVANGGSVSAEGSGTQLTVSGALSSPISSSFMSVSARLGASVEVGSLSLGTGIDLTVDATSSFDIGGSGPAAAGTLKIDAGQFIGGLSTIVSAANGIVNAGTIIAQGHTYLTGPVTGTGQIQIAAAAYLDLTVGTSTEAITFTGATGTLVLSNTNYTDPNALPQLTTSGVIGGFRAGDTLLYNGHITNATYQATGANIGTLTLHDGTTILGTLTLAGSFTNQVFNVTPATYGGDTQYDIMLGPAPGTTTTAGDFNADGKSDLLLQNTSGAIVIETQSNLAITNGIAAGNPGPSWHVMGSADFNGDGKPDILLQNDNGAIVDYLMNGTAIASAALLGSPGSAWHVRGAADFNGDGKADVLLQNDDGTIVIWETNGTAVTAGVLVGNPGANWHVEGTGDFNGDGKPDILLQSTAGQIVAFTMNGATVASAAALGGPVPGWAVAGTGDYNGDGKADIVLHNDNGTNVIWETNGSAVTGATSLGNPGAAWTGAVAGVDLNGDGSSDLVLQNNDSSLVGFTLNNTAAITAGALLSVPGAGWHAVGNVPETFIDGTGANANLAGTPGPDQFDLTSYTIGLHQISGFDPAQDSVAFGTSLYTSYAAMQAHEMSYQGGTFISMTSNSALVIQGETPDKLSAANFVFR